MLELQLRVGLLILGRLLRDNLFGRVDACDARVTVVNHVFTKLAVAAADDENFLVVLHELFYDVL